MSNTDPAKNRGRSQASAKDKRLLFHLQQDTHHVTYIVNISWAPLYDIISSICMIVDGLKSSSKYAVNFQDASLFNNTSKYT